jgi:hypothetical protein
LILEEETTNYKIISNKLVEKHNFDLNENKNTRRRVYDALNVIKAIKGFNQHLDSESLKFLKENNRLSKKIVNLIFLEKLIFIFSF